MVRCCSSPPSWRHALLSAALGAVIAVPGASRAAGPTRVIAPPGLWHVGPASPGLLAGEFLYLSAMGGRDARGALGGDADAQVRQALRNLQVVLEAGGLTLAHVVYSQVYLTDMRHLDALDRVWGDVFPHDPPARAVLGVHRLPSGGLVEIAGVAHADRAGRRTITHAGRPAGPYAAGVLAGGRVFLSGTRAIDPVTGTRPSDPDREVQLALDDMHRTLGAAGLDFRHVVFVNPYLTDGASRRMNAIYARHFEFGNTPARATIAVTSLPGGATVQFTGVAVADLSTRRAVRPTNMPPSPTASPCVLAGDTYYCSAKGPFTPGPISGPRGLQGIWAATVEGQVRQTMRNLLDGLEDAGLSLADVVSTTVYLDDMDDLPRFDQVYTRYFPLQPPTRTTVAQVAPIGDRAERRDGTYPGLEQISLVAVK